MTMILQKTGYSSNLPTIRLAFWPPKPRALFMAMRTSALRAVLGTQSRSQSGSGVIVHRRGNDALPDGLNAGDGLGDAACTHQVAGGALGGGDQQLLRVLARNTVWMAAHS